MDKEIMQEFTDSIKSNYLKKSQEYRVLYTIQHCYPDKYESLVSSESPDLIDINHKYGIEVTTADNSNIIKMYRDHDKYLQSIDLKARKRLRQNITDSGGIIIDEHYLQEPIQTIDGDRKRIIARVQNKLEKLPIYLKRTDTMGLAIIIDRPFTQDYKDNWVKWVSKAQDDKELQFKFFFLLTWDYLSYYDTTDKIQDDIFINERIRYFLKISARKRAESEIINYARNTISKRRPL